MPRAQLLLLCCGLHPNRRRSATIPLLRRAPRSAPRFLPRRTPRRATSRARGVDEDPRSSWRLCQSVPLHIPRVIIARASPRTVPRSRGGVGLVGAAAETRRTSGDTTGNRRPTDQEKPTKKEFLLDRRSAARGAEPSHSHIPGSGGLRASLRGRDRRRNAARRCRRRRGRPPSRYASSTRFAVIVAAARLECARARERARRRPRATCHHQML